jgi:hypothetical protein
MMQYFNSIERCLNCILCIRQEEERQRLAQQQGKPTIDLDTAATVIQKVWKGYSQRKKTARLRAEELIFVGMVCSHVMLYTILAVQLSGIFRFPLQVPSH